MRYLVKIKHQDVRSTLQSTQGITKVGTGLSMPDFVLVTTDLPASALEAIQGVITVEEDGTAQVEEVNQTNPPSWALGWISNSGGNYHNDKDGSGVDIYVVDTGVRDTHTDLVGRVRTLYSFDSQPYSVTGGQSPTHGTSVAGCAAGSVHGTAKGANIVNVRIDFYNSTILKGLDMILRDHLDKPDNVQSILNFSGSSVSGIIGDAFARLAEYGVVVVAAGGNYSEAEPRQPAKHWYVTAVGACNAQNQPAWFTNKGCDVFVPGDGISTISVFSDTSTNTISGTSFSSPYYAGLLACLIEGSDKFNTWQQSTDFTHRMMTQVMDNNGRIGYFANQGMPTRTASSRGLGGAYYRNPSLEFTDREVADFLEANASNLQGIADAAKEFNVSASRIARCATIAQGVEVTVAGLNEHFAANGVSPWWAA